MSLSVLDAAREAPERVALVIGGDVITFGELAARVAVRSALLRPGTLVTGGRAVALVGTSDRSTLETVYALMTLGVPMLLVHPRLTKGERDEVLATMQPSVVLTADGLPPGVDVEALGREPHSDADGVPVDDARCLAVLMTSGTTGRPKGVVLSRRAFVASARGSELNIALGDGDRWLLGLPIAHVGGLSILTRCLLARSAVVVPREVARGQRLDVAALIRALDEDRVTLVSLVPTQLEWLLVHEPAWQPPAHLRAILLGGAAARPSLLARAADRGFPVLTTYGLTEACSQVTTQVAGTVNRGELGAGTPMAGVEVRIEGGVIQVRSPTLLDGYVPPSAEPVLDADGWLTTNDLGRLDAAGNLHVLGRRSEVVITGGENVHPAEVEAVVDQCAGVAASCAFGVPDDTWGELLAVAIVAAPKGAPADAELAAFVRDRLSPHRRPRLVALVSELSTNATGKLDRAATRERAWPLLRKL